MRSSHGARRTGRRVLGVAVAGGAAVFVLVGGGVAMACTQAGHAPADRIGGRPGVTHVITAHNSLGAGHGKSGRPSAPVTTPGHGQRGWNRVTNTPGPGTTPTPNPVTTGGTGGQGTPGSTPTTPAPVTTGGQGGNAGLGTTTTGGQGGNGGPGGLLTGGQGGNAGPGTTTTGGQGGNAGLGTNTTGGQGGNGGPGTLLAG